MLAGGVSSLFFKGLSGGRCVQLNSESVADEEEQYWGAKPSEMEEGGPEGRRRQLLKETRKETDSETKQARDKNNRLC